MNRNDYTVLYGVISQNYVQKRTHVDRQAGIYAGRWISG